MKQIPLALRVVNSWLVWKLVQKEGEKKPRKVPFYVSGAPRSGSHGSAPDRASMGSYDAALKVLQAGGYTGLGFALMPEAAVVALDFDNCLKGGVLDHRIRRLVSSTYSEISPSGVGIRAFMKGSLHSRKDNAGEAERNSDGTRKDGLFDIEFFGDTGFVTVTGNPTEDCDFMGLTDTVCELTDEVRQLYQQRFGSNGAVVVQTDDMDDLMTLAPTTLGWTLAQAEGYLEGCDPSASRDNWLKVLMAMHHEFAGSPEAFDLVDKWSSCASKYAGRADVEERWQSFGRARNSDKTVTGKWLLNWRRECMVQEKYSAVTEWKKEISQAADEMALRETICPKIKTDFRIDDFGREAIAQLLVETFKRLGSKYGLVSCRKLVAENRMEKTDSGLPNWLNGWVYVTDPDKFYRMDSDEWLSVQGFNARMNRNLPVGEDGKRAMQASEYANDVCRIPVVTRGLYLPWAGPTFDSEGVEFVNTYRPSSPPKAVEFLSPDGIRAKNTILEHLRLITGGREAVVATLVNWMAHNVQQPGVKIRWAPLIKGVEGDGKSLIGEIMSAVMGPTNVRNASPKVLNTDFTGWAEGSAVVVLEEIKLHGHNKFDILNALKPFITNHKVEIHKKGKDGKDNVNTVNYIAFTNYADALPLTETDRRWWVIFTPFATLEELAAAIAPGAFRSVLKAYFDKLHQAIQLHPAELRCWLLGHHIDESFQPNSSAPMTDEKSVMIGMGVSDDERTVRELLENGAVGITKNLFASSYLSNEAFTSDNEINLATSALSRLLIKMGYTRLPKKLKWRNKTEIIWVLGHKEVPPNVARAILDGTIGSQSDDLF